MSDNRGPRSRIPLIAIVGIGLLLGFLVLIAATRKNMKAGLNTPIRFDDFDFQVNAVQVQSTTSASNGMAAYIVTLQVDNRAKRVSFTFDERRVVVRDSAGKAFRTIPPASTPTVIPAGSNATFTLRFNLPADMKEPRMSVLASDPVGDVLEFLIFGDKEFSLPGPREVGQTPESD